MLCRAQHLVNPGAENKQGAAPATRFLLEIPHVHILEQADTKLGACQHARKAFLEIPGWMLNFPSLCQCDCCLGAENTPFLPCFGEVSSRGQQGRERGGERGIYVGKPHKTFVQAVGSELSMVLLSTQSCLKSWCLGQD